MLNWHFKTFSSPFQLRSPIKLRCVAHTSTISQDFVRCSWLQLGLERFDCSKLFLKLSHSAKYLQFAVILWSCDLITNRSGKIWLFKVKTFQHFFSKWFGNFLWSCALITSWSIHHRQKKVARRWKLDLSSITGNCNQLFLPRCPLFNDEAELVIILE